MTHIPEGPFGERVARRLTEETIAWLSTVGADGTPQPNPVWFLWDGADSVLVYNRPDAQRLRHLAARPNLSLNLNSNGHGGDVVVVAGTAQRDATAPAPDRNEAYLAKYRDAMVGVSGTIEKFAADYPVPLRIDVRRIRGF